MRKNEKQARLHVARKAKAKKTKSSAQYEVHQVAPLRLRLRKVTQTLED
jgi:hypothetical protein